MSDVYCISLYKKYVIKYLKDAEKENIYHRERSRKLRMINNAINLYDLRVRLQTVWNN